MTDSIIQAIQAGQIGPNNISFDLIRSIAAKNHDRQKELGYGRNILTSQDQLDQYLYSYGPMTKSQWSQFLDGVKIPPGELRLIDYGCGQGLASVLLFDRFGSSVTSRIKEAILIEPSAIALERAKALFACYCNSSSVVGINKRLDDLTSQELGPSGGRTTLHLFSNVLDIPAFDLDLFVKMLQTNGSHCILAVSHDRNFEGGSSRFLSIASMLCDPQYSAELYILKAGLKRFKYSDTPLISLQLQLEVLNGTL